MKNFSLFFQSLANVLFFLFIFSQISYAGETFTKISSTGVELLDNATEWSCVKHNSTGQIWEVKTDANKNDDYSFDEAANYAAQLNNQGLCGFADWRVPTIKELISITDKTRFNPAIDTSYFPNTFSKYHWSASPAVASPGYAWSTSFEMGITRTYGKGTSFRVRLVRGGQYFDFFDYTKLDSNGNDLPDDALSWSCIRDNHNGLIWEIKTAANKYDSYTFIDAPNYAALVNSQGLCGYSDWRVADVDELVTILNYNTDSPAIKTDYFPNTDYLMDYWSASPGVDFFSTDAWYVSFFQGSTDTTNQGFENYVRLVRPGQSSVSLPVNEQNAVIDFPTGLKIYDHGQWTQIHIEPTTHLKIADLDNNGLQDIIVDFGATYGIWLYMNNSTWTPLHSLTSEGLTIGNMDNNGQDDIIIDFGSQYGLWVWMNNSTWTQLHSVSPEGFVTADMDNNDQDEVIIDFGSSYGIWIYQNSSTWQQLHGVSSSYLASGDMDGNGQDDVVVDFGSVYGIWVYYNNSTWIKIHPGSSNIQPVTGDLDGNGRDDVVIDFGSQYGIWTWINSTWQQLHGTNSEQMSVRYLDDNNQADLLIDFGSQYGLWAWKNNSTWEQLDSESPILMGY